MRIPLLFMLKCATAQDPILRCWATAHAVMQMEIEREHGCTIHICCSVP